MPLLMRNRFRDLAAPARKDFIGHLVGLIDGNMLGNDLRGRKPVRHDRFAEMDMLSRTKIGAKIDGEKVVAMSMVRRGLGTHLEGAALAVESSNNFGGIKKGVDHQGTD